MAKVSLKDVVKIYPNGTKAVKGINIDINDKEFIVIVGPSGCGKTTTLRMIAGLEDISEGTISIGDVVINDVEPKDRDIAMVFQNYALYPHMTVYQNMAFGLKLRKTPKDEIDRRVKNAARLMGIENLLDRKPKQLSGGQRQRVAVGRAIVREPKVFLFDEPLSNLDAKLRVQMRTELKKLHQRLQATIIYVTHDQIEAMTMADRIVILKDGVLQQFDTPFNVYHNPSNKFVAGFIGSPPMNFLEAKIVKKGNELWVEGEGFSVIVPPSKEKPLTPYIDKNVIFGIRPEDIYDKIYSKDATEKNTVTAKAEVIEPIGNESYLHCRIGGTLITARVDYRTTVTVNQSMDLVFDINRFKIFDSETEESIA